MTYPLHRIRKVHDLDGIWEFAFLGDADPSAFRPAGVPTPGRMSVPGAFDAMPAWAGKRGAALYRVNLEVTPGMAGRIFFGAASLWCRVYVDGEALAEHGGGYTGFWVDVPPGPARTRRLEVLVDNRFHPGRTPLHENYFDFYQYGGLLRSVAWHEVPGTYIRRAEARVRDLRDGRVEVRVELGGTPAPAARLRMSVDGGAPAPVNFQVTEGGILAAIVRVPDPEPWSPASPRLHSLGLELEGPDGAASDDLVIRFGLRTVEVRGDAILLNGEPVKLLGYCRHEAHPQFGPALPLAQLVADLQRLADLGCNFIRGSHYPQDQRFLDLCDELGFLVWEENTGWQQQERHFADPAYREAHARSLEEMVALSANHPCVILWGFLNEGHGHLESSRELYAESFRRLRALDPTRPVTYASMHPFDDLHFGEVDVIAVNTYPGWYEEPDIDRPLGKIVPHIRRILASLDERGFGGKPFLLSEIGAEGLYGWRDPHDGYWTEEYQADYLRAVCAEAVANPRIAGVALWQFHDIRTYQGSRSLGRARAFNNKGTLDEYRRPKAAYRAVRDCFRGREPGAG